MLWKVSLTFFLNVFICSLKVSSLVSEKFHLDFIEGLISIFFTVSGSGSYQDLFCFFFWGGFSEDLSRVSLKIHTGNKKAKKRKNRETVKTGGREAKEQEVGQQKDMTEEKKKIV